LNTFGKRVQELRAERGVSQKELAARIGVRAATVSRYESDQHSYQWEGLVRIADALDTSVDYLLGQTDVRAPIRTLLAAQEPPRDTLRFLETYSMLNEKGKRLLMARVKTLYHADNAAKE
jgi:transcriptional regulator with XRE-family HTH domain